eukprot:6951676-Ditylum_brightwellii.AAC.1
MVMMFDAPEIFPTCPGRGHEVVQAYEQLKSKSMAMGKGITMQPGDLLVINNSLCVNRRTAYKPCMDGTDMWLVKTYVLNGFWEQLGTGKHGPATYPILDVPSEQLSL